jgi:hypothetical protein
MRLPNNSIKRIVKNETNSPIENNAIYFLALKLEDEIKEITKLALEIHQNRNKNREDLGIPIKKRLSEELFKEAYEKYGK